MRASSANFFNAGMAVRFSFQQHGAVLVIAMSARSMYAEPTRLRCMGGQRVDRRVEEEKEEDCKKCCAQSNRAPACMFGMPDFAAASTGEGRSNKHAFICILITSNATPSDELDLPVTCARHHNTNSESRNLEKPTNLLA